MPLFILTGEIEIVVEAVTCTAAEEYANGSGQSILMDEPVYFEAQKQPMYLNGDGRVAPYLPGAYENDSLPWGGDGESTIDEILRKDIGTAADPNAPIAFPRA